MAFDPTSRHPAYEEYLPSWQLMRDAMAGEDDIKKAGEKYLPMKSGTRAIENPELRAAAYEAYKLRAEFPELLAPTVRGAVGTMLDDPAKIELPAGLEPLREMATRDGLTLDALHRRIITEQMVTGRYGILPGVTKSGSPYLAGYITEAITNWDTDDEQRPDWLMLNETRLVLDRSTGDWSTLEQYRECYVENGRYMARVWTKTGGTWKVDEPVEAANRKRQPLDELPFIFVGTSDLTPDPDDVPLYGLAKLAVRVYRLDADYTFALHMTSEPTPVAIGFDDPKEAVKQGRAPTTLGSSKLWILPAGGDAKYLEFSGPGLAAQEKAIQSSLDRAVIFGANLLADTQRTAESGEAIKLRLGNQTSTLKTVLLTASAGLEKALKNLAVWMGEDPNKVVVTPNVDFFDHTVTAQEIDAIVRGWQAGAYSWRSAFSRLQKGGVIPEDRTPEEELEMIDQDEFEREDKSASLIPPNRQPEQQQ
ncbi:uncharacterized protein DUF4055 [Aquamicrobium defluvii]|uniref:Uncharacterized protein DUF4055 n=2 Tax=Aquamicrobium defluvii TaxID=69279 RepID=A0A4R6YEY3_9HYPH|nr:uncharacterized protein DUF4055 [Aquamicrobium defluvii]